MNKTMLGLCLILAALFSACSGGAKKVIIMASGKISVDANDQKKIKLEPGTTHTEKEIVLTGGDESAISVQTPEGNKNFDVKDNGNYLLNLKSDTLVGGIVKYGEARSSTKYSMEDLDRMIDSTQQLMSGKNASDANKTYFVPPFSIKKITSNNEAKLIGPYNGIPGNVQVDKDGNGPETYKFFTNKQKRESLNELITRMKE